jgi:hypothetical protein
MLLAPKRAASRMARLRPCSEPLCLIAKSVTQARMTKITTLDFESFLIQPAKHAPKSVCLAIDFAGDELLHSHFDSRLCEDRIQRALDGEGQVAGANVPYDLALAALEWPSLWEPIWKAFDELRVFDIQTAEKLSDLHDGILVWHPHPTGERKPNGELKFIKVKYSLADIVKRRFNHELDKNTWRLIYGTLFGTPCSAWDPGARQYPLDDMGWTRAVLHKQLDAIPIKLEDVRRQTRAQWWIHLMTCRGFALNRERVQRLEDSVGGDMEQIAARLKAAGLVRANGKRDTKAAADRLVAVLAAQNLKPAYTPKGKIKLTDETCTDSKDPALIDYAAYSERVTTIAKVRALKDAAQAGMPIQAKFEVLLATGRTSCSGGKVKKKDEANRSAYGFQLQNVKREPGLRECFGPRPGYVLGSLDYGQLELCTWAQVCLKLFGKSDLAVALNKGVDVHCLLGARLFKTTYEWVLANKKDKTTKAPDARQAAKPLNFGLPGGMGKGGLIAYARTQYGVEFSPQEAGGHIHAWQGLWPEHKPYFDWVRDQINGDDPIVQLYSRRARGGCGFTDGCNTLFQGLAADAAKHAGYHLARACYTGRLHGAYIVDFIHDEFLFEFPESEAHWFALEAARIMEAAAAEWIPDVPPKVEPALMLEWSKDAGPVWENGKLVPWRPKAKKAA